MLIFIEKTGKEELLQFEGSVSDMLGMLEINHEEVLVSVERDGAKELLTLLDMVKADDIVTIHSVISGG